MIFCGILLRTPEVSQTQRRTAINSAIGNSLTVIPILVYQVLLADKLDGDLSLSYTVVSVRYFIIIIYFTVRIFINTIELSSEFDTISYEIL